MGKSSIHKHLLNICFIIFITLIILIKGFFSEKTGDIWEHAAVISNLSNDFFSSTKHPMYGIEKPHAFNSPYHLFGATIEKIFGISSLHTIMILGVFNLFAFFIGIYLFIPKEKKYSIYLIVLSIMFLWYKPPHFSGFISFEVLPYIYTYPSFFCLSLIVLTITLISKYFYSTKNIVFETLFVVLTAVITLSHPISLPAFLIIVFTTVLIWRKKSKKKLIGLGVSIFIGLLISFTWPYYSLFELIVSSTGSFNEINAQFYTGKVLYIILPVLVLFSLLLPTILQKIKSDKYLKFLLLTITTLTTIYIIGFVFHIASLSRTLSYIILLSQLLIGIILFDGIKSFKLLNLFEKVLITISIITIVYKTYTFHSFFNFTDNRKELTHIDLIKENTEVGKVILSDIETSWSIPSTKRYIIACLHPQAFENSNEERKNDITFFLSTSVDTVFKKEILKKYNVDYILIKKEGFNKNNFPDMEVINEDDYFYLFKNKRLKSFSSNKK